MTTKLVLIRHGQSLWNQKNIFTGWTDIKLSTTGIKEAKAAGQKLKKAKINFDLAFTSVLSRAIQTLWFATEEMDTLYLPTTKAWQLNERHYGGLQGLNKAQMTKKVGEEQVKIWRRSYDIRPPKISKEQYAELARDPRYAGLKKSQIPYHESLKDTCARVWPYYQTAIEPELKKGKNIIIAAHGNSLRGLITVSYTHLTLPTNREV